MLRALGPYGSPNNLGLLIERILPLALALLIIERQRPASAAMPRWRRAIPSLLLAACCLLLLFVLFLTYSVGAWIGAAAGLLALAALRGRRMFFALAAGMALATLLLLPVLQVDRITSHLGSENGSTTALRIDLWRSSLEMVKDHPVQGVGMDGFLEAYSGVYIRPAALREPDLSHPHNLVLEWWLFLGILGVAALAWLLLSFFWHAWRWQRITPPARAVLIQGAMAAMTAAVVHSLADRFYFGAPDLAFIFFALLVLVDRGDQPDEGED